MQNDSPIIILGSERSGTNLLRHLLSNHSRLAGPVSPHFIEVFFHISHFYDDLHQLENLELLYGDMLKLANHPYHDWQLNLKFTDYYEKYAPKSMIEMYHCMYLAKAEQQDKRRYVSKDIHAWQYAHQIKSVFPGTRFIYLVRDPRVHVRSWMKRPIFMLTPVEAVKKWKRDQYEILNLHYSGGIDWYMFKYEDLISDPQDEMSKLLQFLNEPVESSCFNTNPENAAESKWNDYWKNIGKQINRENKEKFKDGLGMDDIELIETLCFEEMNRFGYQPVSDSRWKPTYRYKLGLIEKRKKALHRRKLVSQTWQEIFYNKQAEIKNIQQEARKRWQRKYPLIETKINHTVHLKNLLRSINILRNY